MTGIGSVLVDDLINPQTQPYCGLRDAVTLSMLVCGSFTISSLLIFLHNMWHNIVQLVKPPILVP